ncbi:tail completion or Neck1 protein [Colwellia phage 9A]|uniref:Uncharacterized protein n=1 Tax=Colwellia phage 9A TaxID=765765 RepID=I3UME2_9CAUD|nr:tail completion or Neck1 protein [Colwellia phage 9A]AFK66657.1 hypothetical protein COPG_00061 [Colwellia phage 9A]
MALSLAQAAENAAKALKEVKIDLNHCYRETLYDIGDALVFYTPLKTGLASSNWNLGTGRISTVRKPVAGLKGTASLEAFEYQIESFDLGKSALFSNSVDYVHTDLERGTSTQAPAGMVTPTKARIDDIWFVNLKKYNLI